ncbi:MAG TPA: radical SAM family heme chaperone HemW [Longimicrobiales bacterium]|nr:radical SAM family heme chaperone HemW [Longimicrobiales bacterium]
MKPESLYVHVPFCVRRCGYCDFAVTALRDPPVGAWSESVRSELGGVAAAEGWVAPLELGTLYVGGGTPSLLGVGAMTRLGEALEGLAIPGRGCEWTAEANPESLTRELSEDWLAAGVNRLSLGVQTFHDATLRWMGRLHGPEGAEVAVVAARSAGFDNLNVDLIFGLPEISGRNWAEDLDRALALDPEHVSLYGLTAEPGTPLGRRVAAGREAMPGEERYEAEYLEAAERLGSAGFEHYEVSNFAKPGRASRHNRTYWDGRPWIGLGPGAHSFVPPRRWWNTRDWAAYRSRLSSGVTAREGEEVVDEASQRLERAWLGLRTSAGLPLEELTVAQRELATSWRAAGRADVAHGALRLTVNGWLLLDRLAVELAAAGEEASVA